MAKFFKNIDNFLILFFIFSVFICSCETVKTKYVETDRLNDKYSNDSEDVVVKITGLILKNGTIIDLKEKDPKIAINGNSQGINYDVSDTERKNIPFDEISLVKIDIVKSRTPGGGPTGVLIAFGATLFMFFLYSLSHIH